MVRILLSRRSLQGITSFNGNYRISVYYSLPFLLQAIHYAHPFYVDSTPKPFQNIPKSTGEVSVFFSEPIELSYSEISVLGPNGKVVSENDAHNVNGQTSSIASTLQENLPPGIYTVNTKVLSAVDGHVVDNTFTFGIGTDISASNANDEGGTTVPNLKRTYYR